MKSYKHWVYHGETIEENLEECNANSRDNLDEEENTDYDDLIGMVHDACAFINTDVERDDVNEGYEPQEPNPEAAAFYRLLKDTDKNLYPGCDKELLQVAKDGCAKGAFKSYELNAQEFTQAQAYVLRNCEEVWPYIEEHKKELEEASSRNVLARHHKEFSDWFYERVSKLKAKGKASEDLLSLAIGPFKIVHRYGTYIVNRFRFHARDRAIGRKSQNSGVLVKGDDTSADKEYYGVLEDIFELLYVGNKKVVLFKCHWWDVGRLGRGYRVDNYGYISINIHGSLNTSEPFVLASQAQQVFYVEDLVDSNWLVVVKTYPHDAYDMPSVDNDVDDDDDDDSLIEDNVYQQEEQEQNF
ncbi:uncharacterized protein [Elaeis guineensis]|uniref:uncharacterized protein n=1 Tax=Elaeis guineensis var. tenera TaxID=51953 RepID=UPI003C6CF5DE